MLPATRISPLLPLFAMALAILIYATAITWTQEDTNITLRVVDNALNGYGLRWNIDERVQVFTHPLWLLLLIPTSAYMLQYFPQDPDLPAYQAMYAAYFTLSLICIFTMLTVLIIQFRHHPWKFFGWIFIPLISSAAFMDYTTSGLEPPMSFLLITLLLHRLHLPETKKSWFHISLLASLLLLNRLDLILLFAPALALRVWQHRSFPLRPILLGASPLLAWWSFALVYYGFIMPNSYYAKLSSSFPRSQYIEHGLYYLADFTRYCPTGAAYFAICIAIFINLARSPRANLHLLSLLAGALLYILYVINIGGDYMSGRLFAPALCFLIITFAYDALNHTRKHHRRSIIILTLASIIAQPWAENTKLHFSHEEAHIWNDRFLRKSTCFFCSKHLDQKQEPWSIEGLGYREKAKTQPDGHLTHIDNSLGLTALFAGPNVTFIDELRITDPLLSRLPVTSKFIIGHFSTEVPKGYSIARTSGNTETMEPKLGAYYNSLRLITNAPIWSTSRWQAIFQMNLGLIPAPTQTQEHP